MRVRLVLAVVALGLTAGCAGSGPRTTLQAGQYAPVPAVEQATLPPPQLADQFSESRPYRIGPFDKLSIEVFGVQDLTRQVQADAGGRISFPLVGTVEAFASFWASAYRDVIVFLLIIPVLFWRSLSSLTADEGLE